MSDRRLVTAFQLLADVHGWPADRVRRPADLGEPKCVFCETPLSVAFPTPAVEHCTICSAPQFSMLAPVGVTAAVRLDIYARIAERERWG